MPTRSAVYYWNSVFVLLTACAVLAGCSSSPSVGDGQKAVQERIDSESGGRVRLKDFRKDNGVQGKAMGIKIYSLEFSADCEFTEDCKWVTGFMGSTPGFGTAKLPAKNLTATQELMEAAENPGQPVRKGQILHVQGTITFEKKEKGWTATEVEVAKATLADAQTVAPSSLTKAEKGDAAGKTNLDGQGQDPAAIARRESEACVNNLRQIGLAFTIWGKDNGDRYPFNVSVSEGGTMELSSRDAEGFDKSTPAIFNVLSNELSTTKVVVCPSDSNKHFASNFAHLSLETASYRVRSGANVTVSNPDEILAICPIHGHILYADGRVEAKKQTGTVLNIPKVRQTIENPITNGSPKIDSEKILGRWDFDPNGTMALYRQAHPNITSVDEQQLKAVYVDNFSKLTFSAVPGGMAVLKNYPHLNMTTRPPTIEPQDSQGHWTGVSGTYTVNLSIEGKDQQLTGEVQGDCLSLTSRELNLGFLLEK